MAGGINKEAPVVDVQVLNEAHGDNWALYQADCVDFCSQIDAASVGFSVFSPPFGDLFVYSDSEADMGNSATKEEFANHYRYMAAELLRVTKPGRLCAVHCSDLPIRKWKDGYVGLQPFSDDLCQIHTDAGWYYQSRITIWRDPVVEMQRTKALGLLFKQLKKDSAMSRVGMADYVLLFRAPGENAEPIRQTMPVELWQKWASPVWMEINQTNTLNARVGKGDKDEKHLCPLQLDLIERAVTLWSNQGDVVLSPFAGIGSEGVVSIKLGRKFVGVELKESYFNVAARYLAETEAENAYPDLLSRMSA